MPAALQETRRATRLLAGACRTGLLGCLAALALMVFVMAMSPSVAPASTVQVKLSSTNLGKILTFSGFTLYRFTRDTKNNDVCVKISGCAMVWTPLITSGTPTAGAGVKSSLLSTIGIRGGRRQVVYAGRPLYRYVFDNRGATSYVGASQFGGNWYALNASGGVVR